MGKVILAAIAVIAVTALLKPRYFALKNARSLQRMVAIFGIKTDMATPTTLDLMELFLVMGAVGALLVCGLILFLL